MHSTLSKKNHFEISNVSCKLSLIEKIRVKCQILFSGNNKKNIINLSYAKLAKRVVKVKMALKTTATERFKNVD